MPESIEPFYLISD